MLLTLFVTLAIVSHDCVTCQLYRCPSGLPRSKYLKIFRDKCYWFEHSETSWNGALGKCLVHGGTLVNILDGATQEWILSSLRRLDWRRKGVWIGLRDNMKANIWHWTGSGKRVGPYDNWDRANNQPSCHWSGCYETCAQMRLDKGGKWHDYRCGGAFLRHSYICMYDSKPLPTTTTTPTTPTTTKKKTTTPHATKTTTTATSAENIARKTSKKDIIKIVTGVFVTLLIISIIVALGFLWRGIKRNQKAASFGNPVYSSSVRRPVVVYRRDNTETTMLENAANTQLEADDDFRPGYLQVKHGEMPDEDFVDCSSDDGYAKCSDFEETHEKVIIR